MTALWPLANVPSKMTLVHGSSLLPLFKSRSEALTSLRDAFAPPSSPPFSRGYCTTHAKSANQRARRGPVQSALLSRFQSAADTAKAQASTTIKYSERKLALQANEEAVDRDLTEAILRMRKAEEKLKSYEQSTHKGTVEVNVNWKPNWSLWGMVATVIVAILTHLFPRLRP